MKDPFGEAIRDYLKKGKAPDILVNTNYTSDEHIHVSYLFRNESQMPLLEKTALKLCRGKILDIGAAAGCHSLVLQKKGYNVTALEISELAVESLKKRGIQKVIHDDVYSFSDQKYDTLLLLMNGTGIGGTIEGFKKLLLHLKGLLDKNGQILIDSSDIKYMFNEDDGSMWVDLNNPNYYGEMQYEVSYKKTTSGFNWLFVDFETLEKIAKEADLTCKLLQEGEHFNYLAQLK
ncbi:SAM-dependent methyltransferase [Draconibacterium sp.]|nr:SAM-dependent methyltransferase [Draconibacterium sp.]